MPKLNADHAERIAAKLGSLPEAGREHERVYIKYNGRTIASYGIRRSSHDVPHDYIARQIFVTMRQAMDLARCPLSRADYFNIVRMHAHLPILICESCGIEDPQRRVCDEKLVHDGRQTRFTICEDCLPKAQAGDSVTWQKLKAALRARQTTR